MRYLFRWLSILFFMSCLSSCHDNSDVNESHCSQKKAERTVLIYMAAQNTLGLDGYQRRDSTEISAGRQYIDDCNHLLVFIDDAQNPRIYKYTRNKAIPEIVRTWQTDDNSTSSNVLQNILEWTMVNYPAYEYGLVLWSHADGWIPATKPASLNNISPFSFGLDTGTTDLSKDSEGTQMEIKDMVAAIDASGIHFRYIFFDACLMQNIEVAYALRNVSDYVIGSPISIPAAGADYTHQIRSGLFSKNIPDIVTTYYEDICDIKNYPIYDDYGIVISAIQTDKLSQLANILNKAFEVAELPNQKDFNMTNVLNYQAYTSRYFFRPHNYDMQQAIRSLLPSSLAEKVIQKLKEVIIAQAATPCFYIGPSYYSFQNIDLQNYSGVSMFVPLVEYELNAPLTPLGNLNEAFRQTEWYHDAGWEHTGW